eukprot:509623-Rhodomonas_salina.3
MVLGVGATRRGTEMPGAGTRRLFRVNGQPVFINGGNYIASDAMLRQVLRQPPYLLLACYAMSFKPLRGTDACRTALLPARTARMGRDTPLGFG